MPQSALTAPVQSQSDSINSHESAFVQQSSATSAAISPVPSTTSTTQQTVTANQQQQQSTAMSSIQPSGLLSLDHYRFQLYNYAMAERLRCAQYSHPMPQICSNYPAAAAAALMGPYGPRLALSMQLFQNRVFQPEEPKPQHSYIGLIAIAILNSPECKLVLSDIYQYILDNYPYFRTRGPGWRNSIRHNLSLNDCFVKAGRSANGKGHYWAIHPANQEDFKKGDFRRRKAQRKVRKHMGLSVDDDGTDSPSPPPLSITPPPISTALQWMNAIGNHHGMFQPGIPDQNRIGPIHHHPHHTQHHITATTKVFSTVSHRSSARKRQFDVASLLAPDNHDIDDKPIRTKIQIQQTTHCDIEEEIDVEESEESDNNNRSSIFDAEHFHRQHKLQRLFADDEPSTKSQLIRQSSEETSATTDLTDYNDTPDNDQTIKTKKCAQYNVCDIEDDSVHLPYGSMNDDNHLDMPPKIRQHLELANAAVVNAPSIDPRILVSRYYGHRISAVNSQHQYNNAH